MVITKIIITSKIVKFYPPPPPSDIGSGDIIGNDDFGSGEEEPIGNIENQRFILFYDGIETVSYTHLTLPTIE